MNRLQKKYDTLYAWANWLIRYQGQKWKYEKDIEGRVREITIDPAIDIAKSTRLLKAVKAELKLTYKKLSVLSPSSTH